MPANGPMFLFLAAAIVSVFAFLSIAVWVSAPAQERKARDRIALLKSLAEQPGENAAQILAMLREEDRRRAEKSRQDERNGYVIGGSVTAAVGIGLSVMLALMKGGAEWSLGIMLILIGAVLVAVGLTMNRGDRQSG